MGCRCLFISDCKFNTLLFVALSFGAGTTLRAQSIIRQSLGSVGGSLQTSEITIQYCVAQASSTFTSTHSHAALRQGFIQAPYLAKQENIKPRDVLVFPNPGSGLFHIRCAFEAGDHFSIKDQLGRTLVQKSVALPCNEQSFFLGEYAEGIYYFTLFNYHKSLVTTKITLTK